MEALQERKPQVPRPNNFDILRLVCAFSVFMFHINTETGQLEQINSLIGLIAHSAVPIFFVISGFLIFMSYEKSKSLKEYSLKRIKRIYPAYFLVIILCAIGGVFLTSLPWNEYFFNDKFFKYILYNLIFLNHKQPSLTGVFTDNTQSLVNASLWTIRIEVMFYMITPILVFLFRKYNKLAVFLVIYAIAAGYYEGMIFLYKDTGNMFYYKLAVKFLIGQLSFFVSGALVYYYLDFLKKYTVPLLVIALPIWLNSASLPLRPFLPISLAIITFYIVFLTPYVGFFSKFGDLSYGIYIFHFPLLQILHQSFKASPYPTLFGATCILLLMAYASWHFVEKPFLGKKSHYRSKAS
ncbi:acyltransferase family protein [Lyngbya aestuarii]|uniref:acyltransferase family protein n=1 Tax=Lyngbya aestuarii TaxID=118322 RepID=UPI00403DEA6D